MAQPFFAFLTPLLAVTLATVGVAQAITLDLPATAKTAAVLREDLGSYPLPLAGYSDGQMHTRTIEGALVQTAYQFAAPDETTLQLLAPLRAQLESAGYSILFVCDAASCGGFDFRYGTPTLAEPDMHVDLGDYRFLSATKGQEAVSLLVSRSSATGFVQMTHIGGVAQPQPLLAAASASTGQIALANRAGPVIDRASAPDDLGQTLSAGASVAMDDLIFASGASTLSEGVYPSLAALADWLLAHPAARVALVGHTDTSGGLDVNIAVSRKRAESVRQRLVERYGIPATQVEAEGVGYLAPRASNLSDAGRERNRRVEVVVTAGQDPA